MRVSTGDQEVADSIPATRSGNILSWRHELSSTIILSLPLIQEGQLPISGERMCTSTGLPLRGLSLPWTGPTICRQDSSSTHILETVHRQNWRHFNNKIGGSSPTNILFHKY